MEARSSSSERNTEKLPDDTWDDLVAIEWAVPRRDSGVRPIELGSGTQLVASERPTLPPPCQRRGRAGDASDASVHVARIHLHTSMDELLYRLAVGDWEGAYRANAELVHFVPHVVVPRVEIAATSLDYLQEFVLAYVDGRATWGQIVSDAPFEPAETLRALSALVDLGLVGCA
jgi:hypothetical protein